MPTYEYRCTACSHEFEREQRITEQPIKLCPSCGAKKAQRQITQGNFILKGGGWYADLYSSAKPSSPKKEGGSDAGPDTGKVDSVKADTSKTESPKTDTAKPDAGKAEAAKPAKKKPSGRSESRSSSA